jgi:anti-sigma regulatory factor (Ser/Thr protein kinase)
MREIALHLLDICENSVAAQAAEIRVSVCEDMLSDRLTASIEDNGKGMDADLVARIADPFVTSRTTRKVGLGIPLLKAAAEACQGGLEIRSVPGKGSTVTVEFQRSHIDRMPLGDLAGTLLTLVVAYPHVHWTFRYKVIPPTGDDDIAFIFDDQTVKEVLGDVPLTEPEVLSYLRNYLEEGIAEVQSTLKEEIPI